MPILDYNDAELGPEIRRIQLAELRRLRYLGVGTESDSVWRGKLDGLNVVLKAVEKHEAGFLRRETMNLRALQGDPSTPILHGFVEEPGAIVDKQGKEWPITAGLVRSLARGKPLQETPAFYAKLAARGLHQKRGINLHHTIAQQLVQYLWKGLTRHDLIDADLPARDIFVDIGKSTVQVMKIDQGHVYNKKDLGLEGFEMETHPNKYDNAMKYLLGLSRPDAYNKTIRELLADNLTQPYLSAMSQHFAERGMVTLRSLVDSYAGGEFDTDTFGAWRKFPDDITFCRFLPRWESAMEELGRDMIER